jgi:hypothetical protein
MFRWYQNAQVCYAYLSDVSTVNYNDHYQMNSELRRSLWFTRGWTLQELLAPEIVVFYNRDWVEIGTRRDENELISSITGIEAKILKSPYSASSQSVAKTMSWASKRNTTRLEDMAYCLMGLFDVNMPLLYGEGSKAFYRLQLEIIKSSTDESIFAWESEDSAADLEGLQTLPLFATGPAMFQHAGNIESDPSVARGVRHFFPHTHYTMTNKGLQIQVRLVPARKFAKATKSETLLRLNFCYRKIGPSKIGLAIFLVRVVDSRSFVRTRKELFEIDKNPNISFTEEIPGEEKQIYIRNDSAHIDSGKNESNVTSVLLDLRSALQAGFAITMIQYEDGRMDHDLIPKTWEGDFQFFRFSDLKTLHVDCVKPKEGFRITISEFQRPLELSIEIYQTNSLERRYRKLPSDSHLPSGNVVRTVLKKRMVDGEPMWSVEVLIDMAK